MASGIEELVNMLYDMISDAWGLPFGAENVCSSATRCWI